MYVDFTANEYNSLKETASKRNTSSKQLGLLIGVSSSYFVMSAKTGRIRKDIKDYILKWINDENMEITPGIFQKEVMVKNTINVNDLKQAMRNSGTTIKQLSVDLGKQKSYVSKIGVCKSLPKSIVERLSAFIEENS